MLSALLLAAGILAGCGTAEQPQQNQQAEQQTEQQVTVTLSEDGEEISSKEVSFEEGDILLDVMKENFEIEEDGGFITSIDGHAQDANANKYWLFTVNEEMSPVGANEVELKDGDEVVFNLQES
ncbi:hypothetical protein CHH64_05460 [Terribacillus saccharophilus]|uniref:Transcobalamin-like C-terminal domain-containing protein n=2 Tax=Terribacillus saccharophilus TaxID=361277 RepID=A0A268ADN9_9BACI|nr:hypothetical protein CHH64_05460 [Terribacillus saccharophilus]PAF22683.1 hypothetical protein CHH49_07885 [Terribacillus saccharophilus]